MFLDKFKTWFSAEYYFGKNGQFWWHYLSTDLPSSLQKMKEQFTKNDLMMYDWFILVDIKFLKSLYLCIYLSILNSFSRETKLPVVLLSMLLSKPSSSVYK